MSSGKGDDRRPAQVSDAEFDANWRQTFRSTNRSKNRPGATERAARRIGQLEMLPPEKPSE